jgi:flagellar biogenesis protein FliO
MKDVDMKRSSVGLLLIVSFFIFVVYLVVTLSGE